MPGLGHALRRDFLTAVIVFVAALLCYGGAYVIAGRAARVAAVFELGVAPADWDSLALLLATGSHLGRSPEALLLVFMGLTVQLWAAVVAALPARPRGESAVESPDAP